MRVLAVLLSLLMFPHEGASAPVLRPTPISNQTTPIFAVVVGVNRPLGKNTQRLRYADDDAILFHRLFTAAGQSTLLVQPDSATRRLHGSLPKTPLPTKKNLKTALERVFVQIERSRDRGFKPQLYFVYSGHGDVKNNEGYLALADGRLTSDDLGRVLAHSPAINNHVIVDACRSYYLVREKRAGGKRKSIKGPFHRSASLLRRFPHTGFLLSTSSAENSHEWAAFQAGIFSHEVRSGLMGPADANRDGRVTYDEIWAFIETANRRIPNERYRPTIYMRPPRGDGSRHILDMRDFKGASIQVPGTQAGRYMLEDRYGVRLADLHTARGEPSTIWLPHGFRPFSRLYLHDLKRLVEYQVSLDTGQERIKLAQLSGHPSSYRPKGAAHEAFAEIFEEPFGADVYRVRMTCEQERMQATPCPSYYCQYCQCQKCRQVPKPRPGPKRTPVVRAAASPKPAAEHKQRKLWEPIFRVTTGFRFMSRDLEITDPDPGTPVAGLASGVFLALDLRASVYPLATLPGPISDMGLVLTYYRSLGLKAATDQSGAAIVNTTLQEVMAGVRYRWKILGATWGPLLRLGVDFGRLSFDIHDTVYDPVPVPDTAYLLVRLKIVDAEQPLYLGRILRLAARLELDYHAVLSSGQIEGTDSAGYGRSSTGAISIRGGLIANIKGALIGLEGFYQRYALDFDGTCSTSKLGCTLAGGAVDEYSGMSFFAGYQY